MVQGSVWPETQKENMCLRLGAPLQTVLFEGLRLVCFYDDRIVGQLLFYQEVLKISLQNMVKSEHESGNHRGPHLKRQSTWEGIVD